MQQQRPTVASSSSSSDSRDYVILSVDSSLTFLHLSNGRVDDSLTTPISDSPKRQDHHHHHHTLCLTSPTHIASFSSSGSLNVTPLFQPSPTPSTTTTTTAMTCPRPALFHLPSSLMYFASDGGHGPSATRIVENQPSQEVVQVLQQQKHDHGPNDLHQYHSNSILAMDCCCAEKTSRLVTGGMDGQVIGWDCEKGVGKTGTGTAAPATTIIGQHSSFVTCLGHFGHDRSSSVIISGSSDMTVRMHDVRIVSESSSSSASASCGIIQVGSPVECLIVPDIVFANSNLLCCGANDGKVRLYDVRKMKSSTSSSTTTSSALAEFALFDSGPIRSLRIATRTNQKKKKKKENMMMTLVGVNSARGVVRCFEMGGGGGGKVRWTTSFPESRHRMSNLVLVKRTEQQQQQEQEQQEDSIHADTEINSSSSSSSFSWFGHYWVQTYGRFDGCVLHLSVEETRELSEFVHVRILSNRRVAEAVHFSEEHRRMVVECGGGWALLETFLNISLLRLEEEEEEEGGEKEVEVVVEVVAIIEVIRELLVVVREKIVELSAMLVLDEDVVVVEEEEEEEGETKEDEQEEEEEVLFHKKKTKIARKKKNSSSSSSSSSRFLSHSLSEIEFEQRFASQLRTIRKTRHETHRHLHRNRKVLSSRQWSAVVDRLHATSLHFRDRVSKMQEAKTAATMSKCSFQPEINPVSAKIAGTHRVALRDRVDEILTQRKQRRVQLREQREREKARLFELGRPKKRKGSNQQQKRSSSGDRSSVDWDFSRFQHWKNLRDELRLKKKQTREERIMSECTFAPQLSPGSRRIVRRKKRNPSPPPRRRKKVPSPPVVKIRRRRRARTPPLRLTQRKKPSTTRTPGLSDECTFAPKLAPGSLKILRSQGGRRRSNSSDPAAAAERLATSPPPSPDRNRNANANPNADDDQRRGFLLPELEPGTGVKIGKDNRESYWLYKTF